MPKSKKERPQESFSSLTLQTYQTYIQEAFKVFEWLSMTSLASFLKTKRLVMENYCPNITENTQDDMKRHHNDGTTLNYHLQGLRLIKCLNDLFVVVG